MERDITTISQRINAFERLMEEQNRQLGVIRSRHAQLERELLRAGSDSEFLKKEATRISEEIARIAN